MGKAKRYIFRDGLMPSRVTHPPPPHAYLSHNVPSTSTNDWSRYAAPPLIAQLVCIMIERLDAQAIPLRDHRLLPLKSYHGGDKLNFLD